MSFYSITFLFYFLPPLIALYYALSFSSTAKNTILLLASIAFYSWGNVSFLLILLASIFANYILGLLVSAAPAKSFAARLALLLACALNIGALFAFRYTAFAASMINSTFHISLPVVEFLRPVGISFFTFKGISYVVDIYRRKAPAQKNIFYTALYMAIFPQIIMGPVERYASLEPQLKRRNESLTLFSVGCCRFVSGLAKKVLLASPLAVIVNNVYHLNAVSDIPASLAWLGAIAFSMQIYYEISSYTDMAIGLMMAFGFRSAENFNYPYIAKSVTDFWRRWNMTVMRWFDEYIYKSLGSYKEENNDIIMRNLLVMWLLIGLWHGAERTFLIWGILNFSFIVIERLVGIERIKGTSIILRLYTLFVINLLWVVFRSDDLIHAGRLISAMFGANGLHGGINDVSLMFIRENIVFLILSVIFLAPVSKRANKIIAKGGAFSPVITVLYPVYMMALFLICVSYIVKGIQLPFMYFMN